MNKNVLYKIAQFLTMNKNSLVTKLLNHKHGNFLLPNNRRSSDCSQMWNDLQIYRETLYKCCSKLIGKVQQTTVWFDQWIPGLESFKRTPASTSIIIYKWLEIQSNILKIHPSSIISEDTFIWTKNRIGQHSLRSFYLADHNRRIKKGNESFWKSP